MEVRGIGTNDLYVFQLPDPPPLKNIIGYGRGIGDQYWRREDFYNYTDDQYYRLSQENQSEIAEVENLRCTEGTWFFNHGDPTYLTGDNYFFLAHWVMDNGERPQIVWNQVLDFYFYDFCEQDDKCFGSIEMKPRQEGCTQRKLSIYVNRAIRYKNKKFGIQSKTGDDAKTVNFGNLQLGYAGIPHWMKPMTKVDGGATELAFSKPSSKNTIGKNKRQFNLEDEELSEEYLNNFITWKSTSVKGYDGKHLYRYICDEYFKWDQADVYLAWRTVRRALGDDFKRWGKAFLLSTVGVDDEKEKVSEEAILRGVQLWNESSFLEKNSMGFTKTGLYRWFIPAWASKIGRSPFDDRIILCDKYGNVNELEVKKVLHQKLKEAGSSQERIIITRQDPMTPQEALRSLRGTEMTFANNQERLENRFEFLDNYEGTPERPVKYRQGNLSWLNAIRFGTSIFTDDEKGRFKIAYFPEIAGETMRNRVKIIGDRLFAPHSDSPFVAGLDPVEFEQVQYGEGSKPAFFIKSKYNVSNPQLSDIYCLQYFARPDMGIICEDIAKALFFFGARINIERQASSIIFNYLKNNGMRGFLMRRPDTAKWNARTKKDTDFGTPTSPKSIQAGLELIDNYISIPNPEVNENQKDNLEYFWFEETLKQLMECDPKNMKKYDLASAMVQTELASQTDKRFQTQKPIDVQNISSLTIADILAPIHTPNGVISHRELKFNQQQKQNVRIF